MAEPSFDVEKAHRWFAIETNNAVWDYLEADSHSASETSAVIHKAHASCYHWLHAGNEANHARAEYLLANLYACAGLGEAGKRHARVSIGLTEKFPGLVKDWDVAFALDALARSAAVSNDEDAMALCTAAREAGDKIADPQDKKVFDDWHAKEINLPL